MMIVIQNAFHLFAGGGAPCCLHPLPLPISRRLQHRGIHYAWVIVAVTFMTGLASSAALGLGGLLQPLSKEFGWRVDAISSALAVRRDRSADVGQIPYGAGKVRALLFTYNPALFAAGAACLVAALLALAVRRRDAAASTERKAA